MTEPPAKLLDLIYDAATESELWSKALTGIADVTDSQGAVLFGQSVKASTVYFDHNGRLSEECNDVYRERHVLNPWSVGMENQPVGRLVLSDDIIPLKSLRRTLFFDEVLHPQDVAHNAMIALAAEIDFRAAFNLCRSARQGQLEQGERRLLQMLVPHMQRSIALGFRVEAYSALRHAEYGVLDSLSVGLLLLNRRKRVVFANAAARAICAANGPLRLVNSAVTTVHAAYSQTLERMIQAALRGVPVATMGVPHPQDGRLFTVLVSSIRSRDIDRFSGLGMRDPAAMLVLTDPLRPLEIPAEWVMDAYRLTRAEANVALSAASGASVPEIAQRLSVSPNTVKTHLRRVFAKTSVTRQAELARLLAPMALVRANGRDPSAPNGA